MSEFRWEFGSGSYIDVYKDNIACAHFNYDSKLKFCVTWTTGNLSECEWDYILACVKQAKKILKKVKRL